jgi:hypothetical protein
MGPAVELSLSRVRAEPASAALRSRTRTTHWRPPPVSVPPQEGQVRNQETPHNTEGLPEPLPLFPFAEGPSVPAGSQFRGLTPAPVRAGCVVVLASSRVARPLLLSETSTCPAAVPPVCLCAAYQIKRLVCVCVHKR